MLMLIENEELIKNENYEKIEVEEIIGINEYNRCKDKWATYKEDKDWNKYLVGKTKSEIIEIKEIIANVKRLRKYK